MPAYRPRGSQDLLDLALRRGWVDAPGGPAVRTEMLPPVWVADAAGRRDTLPVAEAQARTSVHLRIPEVVVHGRNMSLLVEDAIYPGGLSHSYYDSPAFARQPDGTVRYEPRVAQSMDAGELLGVVSHWGHFFVDGLDRLLAVERSGGARAPLLVSDTDLLGLAPVVDECYAVPQVSGLIRAMGLHWDRSLLAPVAKHTDLLVRDFACWTLGSAKPSMSSQSLRELRERVFTRRAAPARDCGLLFVGRAEVRKRHIRNQQPLVEMLDREHGAQVVYPEHLAIEQAIDAFRAADRVILPIGSAKFNLCFCRPGTRVLCVNPKGYSAQPGVAAMVRHMCSALGLKLAFYEVEIEPQPMLLHSTLVFLPHDVPAMIEALDTLEAF